MSESVVGGKFLFRRKDDGSLDRTTVSCRYCNAVFKYHRSVSSLTYHLRNKHPLVSIRESPSFSEAAVGNFDLDIPQPTAILSGVAAVGTGKRKSTLPSPLRQPKKFKQSHAKCDAITNAIAVWFAKDCRPLNMVTDDGLQHVIRVALSDETYCLPSRHALKTRIDDLYDAEKVRVTQSIAAAPFIALTADYWTSSANDSYFGVVAHFIDDGWILRSVALEVKHTTVRHFTRACAKQFEQVAQTWGIADRVTTLGTDNTRNMVPAVEGMVFHHLPCSAQSLQLSVNKAIAGCALDDLLTKCRKIVWHFKNSSINNHHLKLSQTTANKLTLKQDISTHWNSTLEMVSRLLQLKEAITATLAMPGHKIAVLTDSEFEKLTRLTGLLQPIKEATEIFGGQSYVTCSVVLPTAHNLVKLMTPSDDDPQWVIKFKQTFTSDFQTRINKQCEWLKYASALDPRFKMLKFLPRPERDEVWMSLRQLLNTVSLLMVPNAAGTNVHGQDSADLENSKQEVMKKSLLVVDTSDSDDDDGTEGTPRTDAAFDQVMRYMAEPPVDVTADPLQWWNERSAVFPLLSLVARKYIGTPATTVPCERLFSVAGDVVSRKRASLLPTNVNKLICLSDWLNK